VFSLLSFALANLWRRNRRRSALTILAVACAIVVFCAVMVMPYVTDRIAALADGSPRLVVFNKAAMRFGLPEAYAPKIEKIPHVIAVNRMVWFGGVYDDPRHQFATVAVDVDNPDIIWPEYGLDPATIAAFRTRRDAALVGVATMHRFGWHVGQNVELRSQIYPVVLSFKIVGSYDHGPDPAVFMFRRDYLQEALHGSGKVDMMWVRCSTSAAAVRIAPEIDSLFHNSSFETETETEKAFLLTFLVRFQSLGRIVQLIGFAAVFAIALAVLNGAAMTVRERRREIAVLRTLGFPASQILASLAMEGVVTALIGGCVGTSMAALALDLARGAVPSLGPMLTFGLPHPVMLGGIALALCIGIGAALAPAASMLNAPVAQSMRAVA
jgi:putative ABC transport system permease protein